jgi:hypothetical protein
MQTPVRSPADQEVALTVAAIASIQDGLRIWMCSCASARENAILSAGLADRPKHLKGCRYALWNSSEDLIDGQAAKLAWIAAAPIAYTGFSKNSSTWCSRTTAPRRSRCSTTRLNVMGPICEGSPGRRP